MVLFGEVPGEELVVLLNEKERVLLQERGPREADQPAGQRRFRTDCGGESRIGHAYMIG